jgi:hypothetical protein
MPKSERRNGTEDAAPADEAKLTSDQWVAMRDSDTLRIAEKVRGLALGVLGFCWVIVSSDKGVAVTINTFHHRWIYVTGCIAVLSLLVDLLHTLLHFVQIEKGVELFMIGNGDEASFDYKSWLYKSQTGLFWLKVISSIAACMSLAALLMITML